MLSYYENIMSYRFTENIGHAGYGNFKAVEGYYANSQKGCDRCNTSNIILLSFDNSNEEYDRMYICKQCIDDLFDRVSNIRKDNLYISDTDES